MKVRRVGVCDLDGLAVRLHHRASSLAEELVEEILLRVPPDEPGHLVRASLVCKAWHSILSDDTFRRRYRRFHGTPPLQGYFCNDFSDSTVRFVPTISVAAASPVCALRLDDSCGQKPSALDCRHGRVLILIEANDNGRLIVWDPIAGSQRHLSLPTYMQYPCWYNHAGAVLCAKDGCDYLDCHGGPFLVVLVGTRFDYAYKEGGDVQTWASMYSSETGEWSSPTTPHDEANQYVDDTRPGLLIGDALYYTTIFGKYNIVKYDLRKHELSVMHLPVEFQSIRVAKKEFQSILIKGNDGGLGVAAMSRNCIYMWSWQGENKGIGGWVKYRVMELDDMLLSKGDLICMAEGTNTVFIGVERTGVFTLDLRSRQVRKIGETQTYDTPILPYMSFSTPKY
jgi:hypothetical protein